MSGEPHILLRHLLSGFYMKRLPEEGVQVCFHGRPTTQPKNSYEKLFSQEQIYHCCLYGCLVCIDVDMNEPGTLLIGE